MQKVSVYIYIWNELRSNDRFGLNSVKLVYSTLFLLKPAQARNAVRVCCIFVLDFRKRAKSDE